MGPNTIEIRHTAISDQYRERNVVRDGDFDIVLADKDLYAMSQSEYGSLRWVSAEVILAIRARGLQIGVRYTPNGADAVIIYGDENAAMARIAKNGIDDVARLAAKVKADIRYAMGLCKFTLE